MDDFGVDSIADELRDAAIQLSGFADTKVLQVKRKIEDLAERVVMETTSIPRDENGTPWYAGDECVLKDGSEYDRWSIVDYEVCYTVVPYRDFLVGGNIYKLVKPAELRRPHRPRTAEELADEMEDMAHRMQTSKGRVTPEQILQWASEFRVWEDYLKSSNSI